MVIKHTHHLLRQECRVEERLETQVEMVAEEAVQAAEEADPVVEEGLRAAAVAEEVATTVVDTARIDRECLVTDEILRLVTDAILPRPRHRLPRERGVVQGVMVEFPVEPVAAAVTAAAVEATETVVRARVNSRVMTPISLKKNFDDSKGVEAHLSGRSTKSQTRSSYLPSLTPVASVTGKRRCIQRLTMQRGDRTIRP